jgi:hypothetical protein
VIDGGGDDLTVAATVGKARVEHEPADHRPRLRRSGSGAAFKIGPGTVSAVSDSPLSDIMNEHAATRSPESYERFLALFRACTVGIAASGTPVTDASRRLVAGGDLTAAPDYSR